MKRIAGLLGIVVTILAGCFGPVGPQLPDSENLPPDIILSGETSVFLGDSITVSLLATDPEGDPLTWGFEYESVPDGSALDTIDVDATEATFTPDVAGEYVIRVTVSDGANEATAFIKVTAVSGEPDTPVDPFPADDATNVGIATGLDWADTTGATSYHVYLGAGSLPSSPTATVTESTYVPGSTLDYSTDHVWQIVAINGYGSTNGPEWTFTTQDEPLSPPAVPASPAPADGASGVGVNVSFDWNDATDAAGYDLRMRVSGVGWTQVNGLTSSGYDPGTLAWNTTYEWQITATNAAGSTEGPVWSFTTIVQRPGPFSLIGPSNGAIDQQVAVELDWTNSARADNYDVYFGTSTSPPLAGTTASSAFSRSGLERGTTYYWRVVAQNDGGTREIGPHSFTTLPVPPATPSGADPTDGQGGVDVDATLAWAPAAGASSYDVYFGTSEVPGNLVATVASPAYDPGTLAFSETYFWRIVAVNSGGSTQGPVWDFTTREQAPSEFGLLSPADGGGPYGASRLRLDWQDSLRATSYEVYVGAGSLPVEPTATVSGRSYFDLSSLATGTQYAWRVVARNSGGSTVSTTRSFTTELPAPGVPSAPAPADGATEILPSVTLDWADASDATAYDVFLRSGRAAFTRVATGIASSSHELSGLLYGTGYDWYVVARNAEKSTIGPTWSFRTQTFNLSYQLGGHWAFDGTLADSSGFGHDGVWYPRPAFTHVVPGTNPTFIENRHGTPRAAVAFSSALSQHIRIPLGEFPNSPLTNHVNGLGLSLWFYDGGENNYARLLSRRYPSGEGYEMDFLSGTGVRWTRHGSVAATIGNAYLVDGWNHVAVSWDFNGNQPRMRVWANGQLISDYSVTPFTNNTDELWFAANGAGNLFNGALDDIRIYYRPISETEVLALFGM